VLEFILLTFSEDRSVRDTHRREEPYPISAAQARAVVELNALLRLLALPPLCVPSPLVLLLYTGLRRLIHTSSIPN
jgi:hypothetical protein